MRVYDILLHVMICWTSPIEQKFRQRKCLKNAPLQSADEGQILSEACAFPCVDPICYVHHSNFIWKQLTQF